MCDFIRYFKVIVIIGSFQLNFQFAIYLIQIIEYDKFAL
jgi:hypothetical protein